MLFTIASIAATAFATFSAAKSYKAREGTVRAYGERLKEAGKVGSETVDYIPITPEELQAAVQYMDAVNEEYAVDTRKKAADTAAAGGYDPREILAQIEPKIQIEKEKAANRLVSQLQYEDSIAKRKHIMGEEQRVLQNQYNILMQPSEDEMMKGIEAEKWGRVAAAGLGFAEYLGGKAEVADYNRAGSPKATPAGSGSGLSLPYGDWDPASGPTSEFLEKYITRRYDKSAGASKVSIF